MCYPFLSFQNLNVLTAAILLNVVVKKYLTFQSVSAFLGSIFTIYICYQQEGKVIYPRYPGYSASLTFTNKRQSCTLCKYTVYNTLCWMFEVRYLNRWFCKFWIYFSKYYRPRGSWSALYSMHIAHVCTHGSRSLPPSDRHMFLILLPKDGAERHALTSLLATTRTLTNQNMGVMVGEFYF